MRKNDKLKSIKKANILNEIRRSVVTENTTGLLSQVFSLFNPTPSPREIVDYDVSATGAMIDLGSESNSNYIVRLLMNIKISEMPYHRHGDYNNPPEWSNGEATMILVKGEVIENTEAGEKVVYTGKDEFNEFFNRYEPIMFDTIEDIFWEKAGESHASNREQNDIERWEDRNDNM